MTVEGATGPAPGTSAGTPAPGTTGVAAPVPPGRLGESIGAADLLDYQAGLDRWLNDRRAELDRLDRAAAKASGATTDPAKAAAITNDVVLAMSMWETVRGKAEELRALWDSGRADSMTRERMSRVIWGRLDGAQVPGDPTAATSQVSLAEATTLADALIRQLRTRLAFDADHADLMARLRAIRAALVRAGDLVANARKTPSTRDDAVLEEVERLRAAWARVSADAARGADVTGPLAELETASMRAERDAIVASARAHEAERDHARATSLVARLAARRVTLADLVTRCRAEIAAPPLLAVPDVSRLGEVPQGEEDLAAYLTRLEQVARAMDQVEDAYTVPLRTRASLRYRLTQATSRAAATGRDASPTVRAAREEANDAVSATPCDLPLAVDLVDLYDQLADELPHRTTPTTGGRR